MNALKKIWNKLFSFFSTQPEDYRMFDSGRTEPNKGIERKKTSEKIALQHKESVEAVSTETVKATEATDENTVAEEPVFHAKGNSAEDSIHVEVEKEEPKVVVSEDENREAFAEEDEIIVDSEEEKPESKPEPVAAVQPAVSVASSSSSTPRRRYSPNEVNEQSAQRLARLLVSEIKLYYMNKAEEIPTDNLFDNLRGPIEKSRQHYRERMSSMGDSIPDYFHQELVKSLCDGDESRLGPNYVQ